MRYLAIALALVCGGCAHDPLAKGMDGLQTGLAAVDVGVDVLADQYIDAVNTVRRYCAGSAECEQHHGVTDADVVQTTAVLEAVAGAYDATAQSLRVLQESSAELLRIVGDMKEAADAIR